MKQRRVAVILSWLALCAAVLFACLCVFPLTTNASSLELLKVARPVYENRRINLADDSSILESCYDIPQTLDVVANELIREFPSAIEKKGNDGFQLVLPRVDGGRVRVSEYPSLTIVVRDGMLGRSSVREGGWSHIVVREHLEPSIIEGVWNWLGDKLKV
jgi:hypothetical protein